MKQFVTSRAAILMTGAIFAVITACSDSSNSQIAGPKALANNDPHASSGDTTKHGGPGDTSGFHLVEKFNVTFRVASQRTGPDSANVDPIANATVTVNELTTTITGISGADTSIRVDTTLIATGSTNADGHFTVPGLKGASEYRFTVVPPPGSPFLPESSPLHFVTQAELKLDIILRRR